MPFVVAAGHVVEDVLAFAEVAPGQGVLDACLAFEQPVHGPIQVVLAGLDDTELLGHGSGVPQARGGELGGRMQEALYDHGQYQVALPAGLGIEQRRELQAPQGVQDDLDVPVRERAFDDEDLLGADQRLVFEHAAQSLELGRGPVGEIGQGAFAYALALAPAFAQQDGGARVAVGDGLDIHGNHDSPCNQRMQL